jgi:hypothetical protein
MGAVDARYNCLPIQTTLQVTFLCDPEILLVQVRGWHACLGDGVAGRGGLHRRRWLTRSGRRVRSKPWF